MDPYSPSSSRYMVQSDSGLSEKPLSEMESAKRLFSDVMALRPLTRDEKQTFTTRNEISKLLHVSDCAVNAGIMKPGPSEDTRFICVFLIFDCQSDLL